MKYKIGVFGSAVDEDERVMEKARQVGRELGRFKNKVIVMTGACPGVPYQAAHEAAKHGAHVWGYSPVTNLKEQKVFAPDDEVSIYSKLMYLEPEFAFVDQPVVCKKYRNVICTANCDAGILISGRWGTMNEFTCLIDFGKVVGVLAGTGGVSGELPKLVTKITKEGTGTFLASQSPKLLVKRVIDALSEKT